MGAWSPSFYFYVILAVAQELGVDFLSITHQAALGKVGAGASGDVQQNLVNASYNVAFKRISQATVFLNELIILAYIRDLDNIVTLDGISWEVAVDGGVKPVLVFEKSPLGDLHDFMGTDAATQLSFLDRMTFCTQIAKAIRDLHRARIIHGDVKPHNILMFQNASGNLLVKLSDFGHSRYLPDQEEKVLIYIPISKPWNAPEHHHRGFRFSQAAKMDIFSFGVCCLWLLFYNSASKGHFILDIDSSRADVMLDLAKDYISLNGELDGEMRATLTLLFEQCLPSRPECRSCTMEPILELLHLMNQKLPVPNGCGSVDPEIKKMPIARPISSARFQVALAMPQLFDADFRARDYIFQEFRILAEETVNSDVWSVHQEVCLQVAFCYKMGFGIKQNHTEAEKWLAQSHMSEILDKQLAALQETASRTYHPTTVYGLWFRKGHIHLTATNPQYYREQRKLASVQAIHEREIKDWQNILGATHWIVVDKICQYVEILRNLGKLDKAEELARELVQSLQHLPPEHFIAVEGKDTLCRVLLDQGKLKEAKILIKGVLKLRQEHMHSNVLLFWMNLLAAVYTGQGKIMKAADLRQKLLHEFKNIFGEDNIQTMTMMHNLCYVYDRQGRIKEAITMNERLLQKATRVLGDNHEMTIHAKLSLANFRWKHRLWPGGIIGPRGDDGLRFDDIRAAQAQLGTEHPLTLQLMANTVKALINKVRFDEAIALQEQILHIISQRVGPNHPQTSNCTKDLNSIKWTYRWYRFAARMGSVNLGQYVLTAGMRERYDLVRIWGPLLKKKDMSKLIPYSVDTSIDAGQE